MMGVWSHRPQLLHLGLFIAAYVLGCGFAQLLAIVPGTGISIWPPGGLFMATLVLASRPSWPWWVLAGCLAELLSNVLWFHSPPPAGFLIYAGNALEATAGAWLVNRTGKRPIRLETLQEVLSFVVLGAGVAPVASATVGSMTVSWFGMQSQTFLGAWPLWWIGDATGILIVAPLALVVFQSWRGTAQLSVARWIEAAVLALIFLGVAALSLSGYLPFAYIIMPPLLWAAVRFEFKGAAVALILLALITAVFTISGGSQFAGDPQSQKNKQIMLQLFLAISAFSALIVAAISRQHQLALITLRKSERQLQQLIDAVPALIWCTTPEGIPCYLNKRVTDVTGVTLKDLIAPSGSRSLTVVHPDDREAMEAALTRSIVTGRSFVAKYRQRRAGGPHRWVESRAEPLRDETGAIVQWYGVSVDIEDMMTAQDALRDRERELSQLVDIVPALIWRLTPNGEPSYFNKRLIDYFGLDVTDVDTPGMNRLTATIKAVVHPDDAAALSARLSRSLATGESFILRYRLRRHDGVYRWIEGRAEPMRNRNGEIVQWYGLCLDIEDEIRTQEALRESERSLRQLVETLPALIYCATPDGKPIYRSEKLRQFLGFGLDDKDEPGRSRLDGTLDAIIHPDDLAPVKERYGHSLATGEPYALTHRLRRFDGEYRWVETRTAAMRNAEGAIVQWNGVCFEIEDLIRAQEKLRLAQERLARASQAASLAELSASIAHEVNQPLAAIVANSHACHRWLSTDPPNLERAKITAERIIRDANSAADVVSRIRALFRQSVKTKTSTTLLSVIGEARNLMAEEAARRRVRINVDAESNLPLVAFDRVQIQQVLVNLIRNSLEAMDSAGGDRAVAMRVHRAGDVVQTEITDCGRGVEAPDKIFEPFFTTKERGMGMGLAICRSIVESHGGRLWAENNEPHGAKFVFTLPIEVNTAT